MDRKSIVALLLLTIPLLFLGIVALQELAGVDGPMQVLYPDGIGSVRRAVTDAVIVGSPMVALAVAAATVLRFRWRPDGGSIASISVARVAWVHYVMVIGAALIVALLRRLFPRRELGVHFRHRNGVLTNPPRSQTPVHGMSICARHGS